VDHVYSRFHPARQYQSRRDDYTVLACQACNQERCRRENLLFRDFLGAMELIDGRALSNAGTCAAFRTALTLTELPDPHEFPAGLSGRILADRYLRTIRRDGPS
jgi:hypothetical protein